MRIVVLKRDAGKLFSAEYLDQVFEEFKPTCLGVAAAAEEDGVDIVAMDHLHDLKDLGETWEEIRENILAFQEQLKDHTSLFVFADTPGLVSVNGDNIETHDMQPYVLLSDGDKVKLIAMLRGDFSGFSKTESSHPAEYFAVVEEIIPHVQDAYALVDNNIDKLMTHLRTSTVFKKDLQKLYTGDTGIISLFACNGDLLSIPAKDGLTIETEFGWTTLGTDGVKSETKKEGTVSKLGNKLLNKLTMPKKETPPPPAPEPKTDTAVPAPKMVRCPPEVTGKKNIRNWYETHAGWKPDRYVDKPLVEVRFPGGKAPIKDLKDLGEAVAATAAEPEPSKKDLTAKNIPPSTGPVSHGSSATVAQSLIIPAEIKEKIKADSLVIKTLDQSSQQVPTHEEMLAVEERFSSFSDQTGIDLEALFFWKPKDIAYFTSNYPETVVSMVQSLIAGYARKLEASEKKTEKKEEPKTTSASPIKKLQMPKRAAM